MKSASRSSRHSEERPWLKEKVYDPRRRRTLELVRSSVDSLMKEHKRVSLAALSAQSKEIDPDGGGISESTIFKNQEARLYYEQHRSWKIGSLNLNGQRICKASAVTVPPIKGDRDGARARYRYLKLNKAELVERLLGVEQAHAVLQERWFQVNEEMLSWRLRAERLDPQLRRGEE